VVSSDERERERERVSSRRGIEISSDLRARFRRMRSIVSGNTRADVAALR